MPDEPLTISLDKLASLAVEHWRLSTALAPTLHASSAAPVRHALRKIEDLLKSYDLEIHPLDGLPYDPGLSARVIETTPDPTLPKGSAIIIETLSPLICHKKRVIRPAEIVIATNP